MYSANSSDNELNNNEQLILKEAKGHQEQERQELTIQKLNSANEQLRVHNKMQKDFINIAAHEIRGPIQPILGLTQALRSKIENTEQLQILDVVIRNAKRLQQLTDDLLDVSKIERGSLLLKKEKFDLIDFLSSCIQDFTVQLENDKSDVKPLLLFDDDDINNKEDFTLEADRGKLAQVLYNLLSNAIKFTKEQGGIVFVTAERKDISHIVISVKDTGNGIDRDILPRLFSKFATQSTGQKGEEGTGLGLFICKSIVEAHGGRIWAENNNNNNSKKGATFCVLLPC